MGLVTEELKIEGYERVVLGKDSAVGLHAITAIHSTKRGPACGGVRVLPYQSQEEALNDALRLSKGMSYKSALANIGFGGGKSVILKEPELKSPQLFQAFGRFVDSLGGKYITAKDMNVTSADLLEIKKSTPHVLGIEGEPGSSGDPSPVTARGVGCALEATWEVLTGSRDLTSIRVAIQGLGAVGWALAKKVVESGGNVVATDANPQILNQAVRELGVSTVEADAIYSTECDVFMPCAVGAILNEKTIPQLRCRAVVGCANNQLATSEDGYTLSKRGILYAPDYAVNSGGIINVYLEHQGYDRQKANELADGLYDVTKEIMRRAQLEQVPPFIVADRLAEEKLGIVSARSETSDNHSLKAFL